MKKGLIISIVTGFMFFAAVGVVFAAFLAKTKYVGATFSVGSAELKLLNNLSLGTIDGNLADEINGPTFSNLTSGWSQDYPLKIYNNGTTALTIDSRSNYETVNDPNSLRSYIYVEPFTWDDANTNGIVDSGEKGTSLGSKTIIKWKTEGYDLGTIETGVVKGYVLTFSAPTISDTLQGKTGTFDFEFTGSSN